MRDQERVERRNKRLVGGFIITIMVLSAFGFIVSQSSDDTTARYGGFKFKLVRNQWMTSVDGAKITFNFHPSDVESIKVVGNVKDMLSSDTIAITYDPASNFTENIAESAYFVGSSLAAAHDKFIVWSLVNSSGTQLPEVSCANATAAQPVLLISEGDLGILVDGNCVIASASRAQEFYAVSDRLLYVAFGVMS